MTTSKPQNSIIALAICLLLMVGSGFAQKGNEADVNINKKPLADFGRELKRKIADKEIDLNSPFVVEMSGVINRNGKLDNTKIIRTEGNPKVTDTIKDAVMAFSDAGWFQYLQRLGISEVNILAKQDDANVSVTISSQVKTKERARTLSSGLKMMLLIVVDSKTRKSGSEENDTEMFFLKSIKATADNDKIIIEFAGPKGKVHEILYLEIAKHN